MNKFSFFSSSIAILNNQAPLWNKEGAYFSLRTDKIREDHCESCREILRIIWFLDISFLSGARKVLILV